VKDVAFGQQGRHHLRQPPQPSSVTAARLLRGAKLACSPPRGWA
jgi:hypothetical protein